MAVERLRRCSRDKLGVNFCLRSLLLFGVVGILENSSLLDFPAKKLRNDVTCKEGLSAMCLADIVLKKGGRRVYELEARRHLRRRCPAKQPAVFALVWRENFVYPFGNTTPRE